MTNRYKSACCCDEQRTSVCFNGFGSVPKTAFAPRDDMCIPGSEGTDGFNRYDNWSFCLHDKNEEILAYSERTRESFESGVIYPGGNPNCDCSCCNEELDLITITSFTLGKPPIYAWYRHMRRDGTQTLQLPSHFVESSDTEDPQSSYLYVWRSQWRDQIKTFPWLLPCCADDHKYENVAGYAHDYFCAQENESWLCGYDVDDKQWMYWKDDDGNVRYVTQTEMKLIGHPDYDGWRTNNWGVVQGSENRCGPDVNPAGGPYQLKRNAGYCERGGQHLFLQDILHNGPLSGDGRLYRNFNLDPDCFTNPSVPVSVVPDYGYGNCNTPPYGLWPLNFTFWGVLRREKWWELYWNSIYRKYVCERDPDTGEYINCPDPYENYEEAEKLNIYPDKFAGQCRFPRHIIQACAGVPIFTHELVDKLDENPDVMDWWGSDDVPGGAKEVSRILDPDSGDIIKQECATPAALVMGAIVFSSPLWPEITQKLEEVGILPPPIDYGEDQDYKIFKKTFKYHAPIGSGPTGACCINVESSFGGDRPLYGDCGSVGEGTTCPDESTGSCDEPGADEFCCDETPGRTGCGEGLPEGSGGLCDDYICGINVDIGEDFEFKYLDFLDSDLAQCVLQNTSVGGDPGSYEQAFNILDELRFCCGLNADGSPDPDGFWDDQCVRLANLCGGATCGPQTLCAEINESVCRYIIGGQFHEGSRCVNPEGDPDIEVVQCVDRMDEIGSCCFYDNTLDATSLLHCMEISKDLCDSFNLDSTANNWDPIFNQIPETTIGGSQVQKDAIEEYAQITTNGIRTEYTGLRNCEPLPASDPIEGLPLDTYSFYCGGDPYENNTDYPCDDPPFAVNFEEDDYYFYGSPGGWSHTCFSDESITDVEPGDDPPVSADGWNAFFPQVRRRGRSVCNRIAPCWTAAPYPQQQFADEIPRCDRCCPAGGCPNDIEDCPFVKDGCGIPLLSGCGIVEPEYYPGDDADDPNSDDYDSNPYPEANTGVFTPCIKESVSSTCFGAWFQSQHINFGNAPSDCLNQLEFECVNINNAFFLRVPDGKQEVGEDYTLALDILEPGPTPGGNDESEWGLGPAILAYINRVLGETIRIYEGYQHKIFMTDGSLNLNNLEGGRPIWFPPEETVGSRVRLILLRDAEDGEDGIAANGRELVPYNGNDIDFIVNDNGGAPGANLFLTIDLTQRAGSPNPIPDDIYWGLVFHDPFEEGEIIPVPQRPSEQDPASPGSPGPLFGYYKLSIGLEGQNPGPVVHGLRDYSWYHAPVVGVNPRPSAFFNSDWACSGPRCCHDKLTEGVLFLGEEYSCPLNITDKQQGQPGGESECNYTRLPSDGEGLPDPLCGPCEDDEYCCAYPDNPRCVPKETYCCSGCPDDYVCVFVQPDPGEEAALRCIPREEWESP